MDPAGFPFETTQDLKPLTEIIGQDRGVAAFRFGMTMDKPGYNVFVTGMAGSGRMATVRKMLEEMSKRDGIPDDLCYVNNFKNSESPILIRLPGGQGAAFKKDIKNLLEILKKEIPQLFESQEYINLKKEITEAYEKQVNSFFKALDQKVKAEGFAIVDVQVGQYKRPSVMPIVDDQPMPLEQLEAMVEKGRFPKEEYELLKEKYSTLKNQIDQIFLDVRDLQKDVAKKLGNMDRSAFMKTASEFAAPVNEKYRDGKVRKFLEEMLEDMSDNLNIFGPPVHAPFPAMPAGMPEIDHFQPYQVNLLVDNSDSKSPPIIVEEYPTYRNIFGSIERIVDRSGVWRTDFSRIKAGSLVKASGGYLVINLRDAIIEPGVWPALKRALKSKKLEIQTYDPFYFFTTSGLKPEPIELQVKVVLISDAFLYHMLLYYDEDTKKIFKVRADFDTTMDKNEKSILKVAEFIKMVTEEETLRPFDRTAAAALVEHCVRMTGRQEKLSTSFPSITDVIREADFWAGQENVSIVRENHVERAIDSKIYRSSLVEEQLQDMIDRGTLMIDTDGEVVGQVNGLAVYAMGDHVFGKPCRITASTSMGRAGVINIEREADLSGNTHDKGVLILSGYLRKKFAQDKPLTMSASLAFEQSYSGVDGDSASSTEIYALLSSLSGVPIRQNIAVTGSVNQKGEVQAIGGVNQKIEGFYDCCKRKGLTGNQGVMIPERNLKDLMLRKDVVEAAGNGEFHVYAVKTVDEGIEILTGRPAGEKKPDGDYPDGTINFLVDCKLKLLAEGLKKFGDDSEKEGRKIAAESR
jgi:ATP-dependent Lon protease